MAASVFSGIRVQTDFDTEHVVNKVGYLFVLEYMGQPCPVKEFDNVIGRMKVIRQVSNIS